MQSICVEGDRGEFTVRFQGVTVASKSDTHFPTDADCIAAVAAQMDLEKTDPSGQQGVKIAAAQRRMRQ